MTGKGHSRMDDSRVTTSEEGVPPEAGAIHEEPDQGPQPAPAAAPEPELAEPAEKAQCFVEAGPFVTGAETQVCISSSTFDLGASLLKEAEALTGGWRVLKQTKCKPCVAIPATTTVLVLFSHSVALSPLCAAAERTRTTCIRCDTIQKQGRWD